MPERTADAIGNTPPPKRNRPNEKRNRPMILATSLALLPVAFVAIMTTRDLRPWRHQLKQIRELPEHSPPETILTNPTAIPSPSHPRPRGLLSFTKHSRQRHAHS